MRSGRARSEVRRSGREAARRAREAAACAATAGWGEARRAEAASWAAAGRGAGRERRWRKKAATAWRCSVGSGTRVRSTRRESTAVLEAVEEAMATGGGRRRQWQLGTWERSRGEEKKGASFL